MDKTPLIDDASLFQILKNLEPKTARLPPGFKAFASAVIAHARTQIEAEARAKAVADIYAELWNMGMSDQHPAMRKIASIDTVPSGMAVVPLEPTKEMIDAGNDTLDDCRSSDYSSDSAVLISLPLGFLLGRCDHQAMTCK